MSEDAFSMLRDVLVLRYDDLRRRLARRLGSADLAGEALNDTYLRLNQSRDVALVRTPAAFLFRMAFNIAVDRQRAQNRRAARTVVQQLLEIADDAPDPSRTAEARIEIAALAAIMAELTARQQSILLAARVEGAPQREIAERLGISLSLVEKELRVAQEYCARRLGRAGVPGSKRPGR